MIFYASAIAALLGAGALIPDSRHDSRHSWFGGAARRGQSMVEFALIAPIVLVVMLVGIQFALIGQAALAVSQASYLGARTAQINPGLDSAGLSTAISNQMSPTINGATVTLTPAGTANCGPPRTFGCQFSVAVTYDASSKIFLPSSTLLGISFPTNLTFTESAMTE